MSASPNLRLPYLDANQNQKTVTHNAALRMLDALVNLHVASAALSAPPAAPNDGQCWIVASGGTGAWQGKDGNVAAWQDGAWGFYAPNPGYAAYVDALGATLLWNGTAWVAGGAAGSGGGGGAPLASPAFTGTPTAPTPAAGDNSTRLATTAYADRAAGAGNLTRRQVADAASAVLAADRVVAITALTAARTVALPAASAYPAGATLTVVDESGACSATNTVTVAAAGSDAINGAASAVIAVPYGHLSLQSNTAGKWTIVDAPAPVTSVAGRAGAVALAVADVSGAAPLASPALTGTPTAPNAAAGTNTSQIATTSFVAASFVTYAYASANYATAANATLTGTPTAPTPSAGDNSTRVATTAYADRAAAAGNLTRKQVADAAYTVLATDRVVAVVALTAGRTLALPAASAFPGGATLTVVDESGACSPTTALTVAAAGSDTVNGAASAVIASAYGYLALQSNTAGKWTIVDQPADPNGWTAYTPTASAASGSLTSYTATGRYKKLGRTVFVQFTVNIAANGTAATGLNVTLPFTASGFSFTLAGRENGVSGKSLVSVIPANGTTCYVANYDSSYPGGNNASLTLSGVYESAS